MLKLTKLRLKKIKQRGTKARRQERSASQYTLLKSTTGWICFAHTHGFAVNCCYGFVFKQSKVTWNLRLDRIACTLNLSASHAKQTGSTDGTAHMESNEVMSAVHQLYLDLIFHRWSIECGIHDSTATFR